MVTRRHLHQIDGPLRQSLLVHSAPARRVTQGFFRDAVEKCRVTGNPERRQCPPQGLDYRNTLLKDRATSSKDIVAKSIQTGWLRLLQASKSLTPPFDLVWRERQPGARLHHPHIRFTKEFVTADSADVFERLTLVIVSIGQDKNRPVAILIAPVGRTLFRSLRAIVQRRR